MRVKFCGVTNLEDAREAARLGAWAIGLNHHPESPRFCEPAVAAEIGATLRRQLEIVGVFVNPTLDEIARAAEDESLTMVQLHGDEGPAFCREAARRTGCKVIKALRVRSARRHHGRRGVPHRLPPARRPPAGDARRHRRELRLGAARRSPLRGAADPRRRADPENVAEAIVAARPSPSTWRAGSRPSRASRTTR